MSGKNLMKIAGILHIFFGGYCIFLCFLDLIGVLGIAAFSNESKIFSAEQFIAFFYIYCMFLGIFLIIMGIICLKKRENIKKPILLLILVIIQWIAGIIVGLLNLSIYALIYPVLIFPTMVCFIGSIVNLANYIIEKREKKI